MATAMVLAILSRIREDTRKKLSAKGYYPQEGYILQYLPVPPNCLYVPDISDGNSIMSSDHSIIMLRKVLRHIILRLVKCKLMIYKQQLSSISNLGGQARLRRTRSTRKFCYVWSIRSIKAIFCRRYGYFWCCCSVEKVTRRS
ncbi:hypothetical protein P3L10_012891 [Capsicum annuum]